jgi:hypothetical protein
MKIIHLLKINLMVLLWNFSLIMHCEAFYFYPTIKAEKEKLLL